MKPLLLFVLSLLALYTYAKKNFGQHVAKEISDSKQVLNAVVISVIVGFYDGFILVQEVFCCCFHCVNGFDFLHASA
jgi:uncharacterized membrane protein YfcA